MTVSKAHHQAPVPMSLMTSDSHLRIAHRLTSGDLMSRIDAPTEHAASRAEISVAGRIKQRILALSRPAQIALGVVAVMVTLIFGRATFRTATGSTE